MARQDTATTTMATGDEDNDDGDGATGDGATGDDDDDDWRRLTNGMEEDAARREGNMTTN